jgi:DNA polymerase V
MVIARSAEAKEVGIPMGEPLFKIKPLVKKFNVQVLSSNYTLYGDMSHRVMTTLEHFCPDIEIYSIDEAFLNLHGFERRHDLTDYCINIRKTVLQWTGIPVSVGIANTKTLAKLANRYAKRNKEHAGVMNLIDNPDKEKYMKATLVEDIWGVGRQYTKLLTKNGITNAYEFSQANDKWIRKHMTVMGLRTAFELRDIPCISIDYSHPSKKAIISSRSFGKVTSNKQDIKEGVAYFTTIAAEKMRKQKSAATLLTVFLRTNPFKDSPQYHNGVLCKLPVPTDSTSELITYAEKGLEQIFREGYLYHKVGIMLTGLVHTDRTQISMFDPEDRVKMATVTDLFDKINKEMGARTIFYAASGIHRPWKTQANLKSPKFTTSWNELLEVFAGEKPDRKEDQTLDLDEIEGEYFDSDDNDEYDDTIKDIVTHLNPDPEI